MTAITGRTGNLVGFSTGRGTTPWDTEMEAALRKTDALLASTVVAITNTLPGSANEGDLFLVGTLPTGVAAGWANRIARWRGSPAGWEAYQPMQGWIVTITGEATDKVRRFNGTSWTPIGADVSISSIPTLADTLAGKLNTDDPVATGTLTVRKIKLSDAGVGVGDISWSSTEHVVEITLENGSVLQLGKENVQWCKNETGAAIPNGKLVYVSNSTGDNPVISLASSASASTAETIGMTTQAIADGQHGYVAVSVSFVRNLVTSGGTPGTAIYLTTSGNYSTTPPAKPGRKIRAGFILREHATAGIILLWIHANPSIIDINDADSTSAVTDDVLRRNASGVWVPGKALQVNNPTFTGKLTGPTQYLEADEQILLAIRRPAVGAQGGRIHGVAFQAQTLNGTWREFGRVMTYIGNNTDAAWTGGMRLMAYKDGAILQALEAGPDGVRVGSGLPLQMGTTTVIDSSRNGSFAGLTASGEISGPRASLSEFGVLRAYTGSSAAGAIYPAGSAPDNSNYILEFADDSTVTYLNAKDALVLAINDISKLRITAASAILASGVEFQQGTTTRITAGGDGRFLSLRASGLAGSSTYLPRLDANGELIASAIHEDLGDIGNVGTYRTVFDRVALFVAGYGSWTTGPDYVSWAPSLVLPLGNDTASNGLGSFPSGGLWNSQRLNAMTLTDGPAATPYRGRIRADRWFGLSFLQIQNTTATNSWFAAGTGDGSPTIPANYLKQGRRVRIEGRIFCSSCVQNSSPEISLKVGSTTIFTQAKSFTIGPGNELIILVKADIFIDNSNRLIVLSELKFYSFSTGSYDFPRSGQIDPYVGTVANTIDVTIKPSSTAETWIRSLAFIEI